MAKTLLVTGGAGFIGGCFVRRNASADCHVVVLDKLTYAGSLDSLSSVNSSHHTFVRGDIVDQELVAALLDRYRPDAIVHLAAESHVDRSIDGPLTFVKTNVLGTAVLLEAVRHYWNRLPRAAASQFRFLHVSTDEVYGSLGPTGRFREGAAYAPSSPYSASKAASDHLVRAWFETYRLPVLLANSSNNYGPYQFPEKLVPLMTLNAIEGRPLPLYGDGQNIRDWLFVDDHCAAIETILAKGTLGDSYNIGGDCEQTNLSVVQMICQVVQDLLPELEHRPEELITFVADRPGHDRRYALDATKLRNELHWSPQVSFDEGIRYTVQWYLENPVWIERIASGVYPRNRLGEILHPQQ